MTRDQDRAARPFAGAICHSGETEPSDARDGDWWVNPVERSLKFRDGDAWLLAKDRRER